MDDECHTPRGSLTHQIWVDAMRDLANKNPDTALGEVADFASNVLDLCADTPLLVEYLNRKSLDVMEWRERGHR